jgi:hypothetical protein
VLAIVPLLLQRIVGDPTSVHSRRGLRDTPSTLRSGDPAAWPRTGGAHGAAQSGKEGSETTFCDLQVREARTRGISSYAPRTVSAVKAI